ncbi:MAG: aspartate--tRNA(Asn) ligase [Candidatus Nealsonbacteria bacterium]|nr:aspartate--tRNA(Asn) ligase [Candidatus Nealsonbacteria bacterium]
MPRILNADTPQHVGQKIKVQGWVNVRRDHGKIVFFDLRDRSGMLQIVLSPDLAGNIREEWALEIEGTVQERPEKMTNPELATGKVELAAESVKILAPAESLPFDLRDLNVTLPTLLDFRPLTLRNEKINRIFKVQESLMEGFQKAAKETGCTEIFIPTISASATEGGAEVFRVSYYDYPAYLTQSPQLYKQMMVPAFERVSVISHAYRAEPSVTTRHLSEVVQMDCEFGFVDFAELLNLLEFTGKKMLQNVPGIELPSGDIPRLTLREAQEIIFQETGRDVRSEKDLNPEDEIDIAKWALQKHNSDLVTVTHFPTKKRAFYTMPDPQNPEFSLSYDLLFRGLEISSGSQRINDYNQLVNAIKDRGMDPKNFEMYLQAFRFGMPPEGGFSFGLERVTKQILNLENIREASLFPRDMERIDQRLSLLAPAKKSPSPKLKTVKKIKKK